MELHDGSYIRADASAGVDVDAGKIIVRAGHLLIFGESGISTQPPFDLTTGEQKIGHGGPIEIVADTIELRNGGQIVTSTNSNSDSGTVKVQADSLLISGDGAWKLTDSYLKRTGIFTGVNTEASSGNGGRVEIVAERVEIRDSGEINTSTEGIGNAGTVNVQTKNLLISGDGAQAFTGITSSTEFDSTGSGGTITINARAVQLREGGTIAVQSSGRGKSGSVSMTAANTLQFDRARVLAETTEADAGSLMLSAGRLFDLRNSTVTTSVAGGEGSGGNILINSPLMVFDNSKIIANAQGGSGGNITIQAGQLIRTPDNVITASGSVAGNITIAAPNTDVSSGLVVLPETFFDVSSQLRETCAARGGRPASSFNAGGRGGLPPDPGTPLAANPLGQPLEQQTSTGSPTTSTAKPQQVVKPITVSGIPQPVLGSPRLTCRG